MGGGSSLAGGVTAAADSEGFFLGGGGGGFFFPARPGDPDGAGAGTGAAGLRIGGVVVSLGGVGDPVEEPVFDVPSLAKRFCSSLRCDCGGGATTGRGGFGGGGASSSSLLGDALPMPKAGTDIPAAPSLLTAP